MTAGELAAVVVTVCAVVALVALIVVLTQAVALMRDLRAKLGDFSEKAGPALNDLADASEMARTEITRLRDLMNVVEKVTGLAAKAGEGAAKVAALPLDKVKAVAEAIGGLGKSGKKS